MKLGIRFSDNDFTTIVHAFFAMVIVPTFEEREDGHMVTHLTSSMVVELFNRHMAHVDRYVKWYCGKNYYPYDKAVLTDNPLQNYFIITEADVYWDDNTDEYINDWNGNNDGAFVWTDGKAINIT
jgi:hypothetical protein